MTRDDAIKALQYERKTALHENKSAFDMAIQALEQQKVKEIQGIMEGGWTVTFEVPEKEPCDDAISREAVREITFKCPTYADPINILTEVRDKVDKLPSVTQKSGKWDRLYSWLNDMRFGIAPDETVTDIDERNCRESQTDLLDEIMEWMIKAEGSEKE